MDYNGFRRIKRLARYSKTGSVVRRWADNYVPLPLRNQRRLVTNTFVKTPYHPAPTAISVHNQILNGETDEDMTQLEVIEDVEEMIKDGEIEEEIEESGDILKKSTTYTLISTESPSKATITKAEGSSNQISSWNHLAGILGMNHVELREDSEEQENEMETNTDSLLDDHEEVEKVSNASDNEDTKEAAVTEPGIQVVKITDNVCLAIINQKRVEEGKAFVTLTKGVVKMTLVYGSLAINGYDLTPGKGVQVCVGNASKQFICFEKSRKRETTNGSSSALLTKAINRLVDNDYHPSDQLLKLIRDFASDSHVALVKLKHWEDDSEICLTTALIRQSFDSRANRGSRRGDNWFEFTHEPPKSCVGNKWDEEVDKFLFQKFTNESVVVTVGDANIGKSTLTKRMINRLMSDEMMSFPNVILLDLDPGQSEFGPPGQVTGILVNTSKNSHHPLVSEPFAHQIMFRSSLIASFSCGSISVMIDPDAYVCSVRSLWSRVQSLDLKVPIFVNTIGFVVGAGRDIMTEVLQLASPSHVIEIRNNNGLQLHPPVPSILKAMTFDYDAIFGRSARLWTEELEVTPPEKQYFYLPLESPGYSSRESTVTKKTRVSQVYAAFSTLPGILTSLIAFLPRFTLDFNTVVFHIVHDTSKIPMEAIVQSLDRRFVQLVKCEIPDDKNLMPLYSSQKLRVVYKVLEPEVLGHGILFVKFMSDSTSNILVDQIEVLTAVSEEVMKQVNCVILPNGVYLPLDLIQESFWK